MTKTTAFPLIAAVLSAVALGACGTDPYVGGSAPTKATSPTGTLTSTVTNSGSLTTPSTGTGSPTTTSTSWNTSMVSPTQTSSQSETNTSTSSSTGTITVTVTSTATMTMSNTGASGSTTCNPISTATEQTNACGRTVGIAYSPDGQMLAAGSQTATPNVHLWRLSDGALLRDIEGIGDVTYSVTFSPDSKMLATAGEVSGGMIDAVTPNIVKLWDVATGRLLQTIPATCGFYADSVSFSHDGTLLATAGASGAVELWRVSDGARVTTISIPGTTYNVHFSADDSHLIAAGTGGPNVTVWDLLTGAKTLTLTGTNSDQVDGAFSPDGLRMATTGDGGTIKFWNATTGNLLQTLSGHAVMESHVVWIDDSRLVSDDWQGKVILWTASADSFSQAKAWSIGAQALGLAVSPDRSQVAVAGDNGITFLAP